MERTWLWIESKMTDPVIAPRLDRLWPELQRLGRQSGVEFLRVQWPELRWVPSKIREISAASPEKVILTYSPSLFQGGSLLKGDYSRLIQGLKTAQKKSPGLRIFAALGAPLPSRIFRREKLEGVDGVVRFYEPLSESTRSRIPEFQVQVAPDSASPSSGGIAGTVSRGGVVSRAAPVGVKNHAESLFDFLKSSC